MLEFSLYVNVMLFAIGVLLIFVLLAKQKKHPIMVRAILMAYFLVVMQYNVGRFRVTVDKILFVSAAAALMVWVRQPIPSTE